MKKNLFLAGALALFSFVGVSAQDWCHTVVNGLPGTDVKTTMENGTEVTNRYAETQVFSHAGTKSVRMTVLQTGSTNQIKGGGPTWNLAELKIYDGNGNEISYTATSNADHNTMGGAGNDGAGLPALNDGNLNNYWHSTWSAAAPNEYHYLEFELAETVDAFKLAWWNRPNNNNNCPIIVGLTPGGKNFTEDMKFSEYGFELGERVTSADGLVAGTFAFYVEGPTEDPNGSDNTGPGNVFVSLSGYNTGNAQTAGPEHIVQFIPGSKEGTFVLYQPVPATYYGSADKWTDAYNGKNGWQRATGDATRLGEFEITKRGDGDFEITTYVTRQYVDGAWVNYDTPMKLWVGYDMRGSLKLFPVSEKTLLEAGNYNDGAFHLPVDFGFTIYKANVAEGMIQNKTAAEMCEEVLAGPIETAEAALEKYAEIIDDYDWDGAAEALEEAMGAVERAIDNGDLAAAFEAKDMLEAATALLAAQKANYYEELHGTMIEEYEANQAVPPYTQADSGKYTPLSGEILAQIKALFDEIFNDKDENGELKELTYAEIETKYAQIESLIEQFYASVLKFSTFPEIVEDIKADNFPYTDLPNNAVWKQNVVLAGAVKGIRLTFLDRHIGSAGDGGNFPMIAIGEFKLYDANNDEVTLTETNFVANHTETQEGFESTVARLCDGNFGAQGYYHSPWSGDEPQEYIYIDITFPSELDNFTFEVYSRDRSTSQNKVSLFPKKVAITNVGEAYDPLLFTENPYNVFVGEQVTAVEQLTDGLYVVKGLLNTKAVYKENTETERIELTDATGTAKFYHNTTARFHNAAAAVREASVFRITKNTDGTYSMLNLAQANYWPTTEGEAGDRTGFVAGTYDQAKAAKLNFVASGNLENTFVIYEKVDGLVTVADSIDTDEDGIADVAGETYQTPYVVYMDWHDGLATRPVVATTPVYDPAVSDTWGDAQCFNKASGEGEWEIYKVTMDNPDFCWLTGLVSIVDGLGIVVGDDPGCVSELGALEGVLADGQKVVADSVYADAPAAAAALAKEIAAVETLEKNPMVPGVYQVVSANVDFMAKQNKEKALYATVNEAGNPTFGWKDLEEGNKEFYFDFQKSKNATNLVEGGDVAEEYKDLIYTIRVIASNDSTNLYYVGEIDKQSVEIELFSDAACDYVIKNVKGSAFSIGLYKNVDSWCLHTNQHGGGTGQSGNIVYWNADAGASQWYLRKVDYETSIDDLVTEGTEVVSVAYYTTAGAAIPAPAKGINIVVTTYANGVVEAKKVLVK